MGAAIPFSVREVKSQRESEETGKGLSTGGELVVEVKNVVKISCFMECVGS